MLPRVQWPAQDIAWTLWTTVVLSSIVKPRDKFLVSSRVPRRFYLVRHSPFKCTYCFLAYPAGCYRSPWRVCLPGHSPFKWMLMPWSSPSWTPGLSLLSTREYRQVPLRAAICIIFKERNWNFVSNRGKTLAIISRMVRQHWELETRSRVKGHL